MKTKHSKGFTLIELLVVISIIGLLASVTLVSLNSARAKARDAKRVGDLKQISSALEFFYDTYGRYPVTAGTPFWDGHWVNFKVCLETGVGCGFSISGTYQPVMIKVPNDPLDKTPDISDNSATYYPPYNGNEKGYVLRAILETNSAAFQTDADGDYYNIGDGLCEDASRYYCIKANWVW